MSEQSQPLTKSRPRIDTNAVREVLGLWHNLATLGEHPLAQLAVIEQRRQAAGHGANENGRGLALRELLAEALATLKPEAEGEPDATDKRWHPYLLLHERYVNQRELTVVADLLGIGASTASRKSTAAIKRVVSTLYAREQRARSAGDVVDAARTSASDPIADSKVDKISAGSTPHRRAVSWLQHNWSHAANVALGLVVVALTIALLEARASTPVLSTPDNLSLTPGPIGEPTDVSPLITAFDVASQHEYEWHLLNEHLSLYTDRSGFTFTDYPREFEDQHVLVTPNDDKWSNAARNLITFQVQQDVMVYVLYTTVNTEMEAHWLSTRDGWTRENALVDTTLPTVEKVRNIRAKFYEAGSTVELGGNGGINNGTSMYNVVVAPVE